MEGARGEASALFRLSHHSLARSASPNLWIRTPGLHDLAAGHQLRRRPRLLPRDKLDHWTTSDLPPLFGPLRPAAQPHLRCAGLRTRVRASPPSREALLHRNPPHGNQPFPTHAKLLLSSDRLAAGPHHALHQLPPELHAKEDPARRTGESGVRNGPFQRCSMPSGSCCS